LKEFFRISQTTHGKLLHLTLVQAVKLQADSCVYVVHILWNSSATYIMSLYYASESKYAK